MAHHELTIPAGTPGPRRPIRVDHGTDFHTPQGAAYLTRLGMALEEAFCLAFAASENGGRR